MSLNEPAFSTRYKLACVLSEDSNESVHSQSDQSLSFLPEKNVRPLAIHRSDYADAQVDESLRLVHIPTCTFCWPPDQIGSGELEISAS